MLPIVRQLLPSVLQLTKNPLKLPGVGGRRFWKIVKKIFSDIIYLEKIF